VHVQNCQASGDNPQKLNPKPLVTYATALHCEVGQKVGDGGCYSNLIFMPAQSERLLSSRASARNTNGISEKNNNNTMKSQHHHHHHHHHETTTTHHHSLLISFFLP
jgi:hypothetical protein